MSKFDDFLFTFGFQDVEKVYRMYSSHVFRLLLRAVFLLHCAVL